jgi:ATP-binding cassette subfamily C (CFTR/MRP) protein 4
MESLAVAFKIIIPKGLHEMVKLIAVLRRIGKVLRTIDADSPSKHKNEENLPVKIILSNLDVFSRDHKILKDVNCEIDNGLTVITGSTASGKTLLLKVILEEYHSVAGVVSVKGRISYASQQPWLFASTIKQNVLFGAKYNEERYLQVLQVCALLHDLQSLPGGDGFIVADRGENLSKGQQSRINLARAVYRDSEIYLLDDCLANLDVIVADYIFEKCIKQFLKDKLVVLVTQNPKHIDGADNVTILNDQTAKFSKSLSATFIQELQNLGLAWIEDKCKEENGVVEADVNETTHLLSEKKVEGNIYEEKVMLEMINLKNYRKLIAHGGGSVMFTFICIVFGVVVISKSGLRRLENNW